MKRFLLSLLLFTVVPVQAEPTVPPASPSAALGLPGAPSLSTAATGSQAEGPRAEVEAFWANGHRKEANKRLGQWMEAEKSSPWPWVVAAKLQCEQKKFKKCASLADVALIKSPECGEAYYWKARALEGQDKTLDAANEYRAAISGPNKFMDAQKDLDRILPALGQ